MVTALSWFKVYFANIYNFVFNDFYINRSNNVSLGWIFVVAFVFSVMIKNILSLGRVGQTYSATKKEDRELWRRNKDAQTRWYNRHM